MVVSKDSILRWKKSYQHTRNFVRDPALYTKQGRPLAFSREEAEFVLAALEAEPTLYLDEIQAMNGTQHPISTIQAKLKFRLLMKKKTARTVNPNQCPKAWANYVAHMGNYPAEFLVFVGGYIAQDTLTRKSLGTTRPPHSTHP
ncbi:hypothetical protein PTTG_03989 [Puccinia triticina 1-1 BBBD Race 1]|uniref:Uncharacterized protein n=1 Tax=Puccinia triticina (isolate 1-1 / race 1 (BBBD)) TaxID=630390 RepID=A0A180G5J6_PUCT1|nr:hypothetical protein PTTG_03989 [Puccinia triticina 1-1 BBBD Race 1]